MNFYQSRADGVSLQIYFRRVGRVARSWWRRFWGFEYRRHLSGRGNLFKGDSMQNGFAAEIDAAEKTAKKQNGDLSALTTTAWRKRTEKRWRSSGGNSARKSSMSKRSERRNQSGSIIIKSSSRGSTTIAPKKPFSTLDSRNRRAFSGHALKDFFLISNSILVAWIASIGDFNLSKLFYRRTLRMDLGDPFGDDGTADLMSRLRTI